MWRRIMLCCSYRSDPPQAVAALRLPVGFDDEHVGAVEPSVKLSEAVSTALDLDPQCSVVSKRKLKIVAGLVCAADLPERRLAWQWLVLSAHPYREIDGRSPIPPSTDPGRWMTRLRHWIG
jgi:hypothetical protein